MEIKFWSTHSKRHEAWSRIVLTQAIIAINRKMKRPGASYLNQENFSTQEKNL